MHIETPNAPMTMTFAVEFREVEARTRLTETQLDESGHATGPDAVVEVEFHELDGRTTLELTHRGIPVGSPGEGAGSWP